MTLREALGFYANKENWTNVEHKTGDETCDRIFTGGDGGDGWVIASEAVAENPAEGRKYLLTKEEMIGAIVAHDEEIRRVRRLLRDICDMANPVDPDSMVSQKDGPVEFAAWAWVQTKEALKLDPTYSGVE